MPDTSESGGLEVTAMSSPVGGLAADSRGGIVLVPLCVCSRSNRLLPKIPTEKRQNVSKRQSSQLGLRLNSNTNTEKGTGLRNIVVMYCSSVPLTNLVLYHFGMILSL
jgi:hypothetical protein